jgi:pyruvate ferredoxin oxidoreductase gamma subunit
MKEIRFHGRGGQGAVTAAELFAQAAISSELYAQGFPNFGAERRGAPVMAFLRVSDSQIFLRERIEKPDVVVVLDSSLIGLPEVTEGLAPGKKLIINASKNQRKNFEHLEEKYVVCLVDASQIAMDTIGLPITNTAIIGSLVKATELITLDSLSEPFRKRFGKLSAKNIDAMLKAYDQTEVIEYRASENDEAADSETDYQQYIQGEALYPWPEVEIGCDVNQPGNSRDFLTGNWRTGSYPLMDKDKCISCGICWIMCPEIAFTQNEDGSYTWSGDYCKGCGICVTTCSKKALSMEVEQ